MGAIWESSVATGMVHSRVPRVTGGSPGGHGQTPRRIVVDDHKAACIAFPGELWVLNSADGSLWLENHFYEDLLDTEVIDRFLLVRTALNSSQRP